MRDVSYGELHSDNTSLMRIFYLVDCFVRLELHPSESLWRFIVIISRVPFVEANVFDSSKLELFSEVDKHLTNVVDVEIWRLEGCHINVSPEIESIVCAFVEDAFTRGNLLISDSNHNLILRFFLWKRNR